MNNNHLFNFPPDSENKDWLSESYYEQRDNFKEEKQIEEKNKINNERFNNNWQWSVGVACIIIGVILSLLFKTYRTAGGEIHSIYGQRKDMVEMVRYLQTERNKLQADLAKAREIIMDLEQSSLKGKTEFSTLHKQLNTARQEAGLTPVHGPGIVINLNDSPIKPKLNDDPNYYIVHDIDLMALVNELWASGAEAISINEQRVVMTTPIRCVGPTVTVNTVKLAPPYVVKAIGPADNLETGLRYTGGFMDSMSPNIERGVDIRITKEKDIKIPAFKGSLVNRYAQAYKPEREEK